MVANGPQSVQFIDAGYGQHLATLVTAGSYVLTATFGGKLASGVAVIHWCLQHPWPKCRVVRLHESWCALRLSAMLCWSTTQAGSLHTNTQCD